MGSSKGSIRATIRFPGSRRATIKGGQYIDWGLGFGLNLVKEVFLYVRCSIGGSTRFGKDFPGP